MKERLIKGNSPQPLMKGWFIKGNGPQPLMKGRVIKGDAIQTLIIALFLFVSERGVLEDSKVFRENIFLWFNNRLFVGS